MAEQRSRLYPKLPSNAASALVSSDEEEVITKKENGTRRSTTVERSSTKRSITGGGFCHSTISLSEFENSYFRGKETEPITASSIKEENKSLRQVTVSKGHSNSSLSGRGQPSQWAWFRKMLVSVLHSSGQCLYCGKMAVLGVILACIFVSMTGNATKGIVIIPIHIVPYFLDNIYR